MVVIRNDKSNAFENADLRVHAFNKATGNAVMKEVHNLSLPIRKRITKGV